MQTSDIDTRIGTANTGSFSHGNTLPLTGVPFGMNYLSVQSVNEDTAWWFDPTEPQFTGIRLTHQPSPWINDFQHLQFLALTQAIAPNFEGDYRPQEATFAPDYLRLVEQTQGVTYEATNSTTGGALRFTASNDLTLRLTMPKRVTLVETTTHTLTLALQNFSASIDPDFTMWCTLHLPDTAEPATAQLADGQLDVALNTNQATIWFATSFISAAQATVNLNRLPASFEELRAADAAAWQAKFDLIAITDRHPQRVATFYHNLYRALLFPMQFYETTETGEAVHYDTTSRTVRPGMLFTNNGFWDTYKTAYPFYSLLLPTEYHNFLEGFLNSYRETGFLPRWLSPDERGMMPGTMVDAVIADAAVKQIGSELMPEFLTAMIHGAETVSDDVRYGREGLADYLKLGYVPAEIDESVNKTLDYAYSDWLISVVAGTLNDTTTQAKYAARSQNYRKLFDPAVGLMHPRLRDGEFTPDFDPLDWGSGYTEGSAWQNSFAVYQDLPGLIELTGGPRAFTAQLHRLVNQPSTYHVGTYRGVIHEMREMAALDFGQLAISNQPSFHLPYLFAVAGDAAGTQLTVKQLLLTAFNAGPTGYPGDEDNGSMSSWYLWSSLGLYPVTPGSGEYVLGIPFFDAVTIHLPNDKTLTITTANNHNHMQFVGLRTFNGAELGTSISHNALASGGTLASRLQLLPNPR